MTELGSRHAKRVPPPPPTKDQRDVWSQQLTNIEMTQLATKGRLAEVGANTASTLVAVSSLNRWATIRDLLMIILLVSIMSFELWRAWVLESAVGTCAAHDAVTVFNPSEDKG